MNLSAAELDGVGEGATRRVYRGVLEALERHELAPGQRLIETELAAQFGVGRNAVREAIQRLAVRGIVDLSRHRSAAIRRLDLDETLEVLDVSEAMIALLVATAARRYRPEAHHAMLAEAIGLVNAAEAAADTVQFGRARRAFYHTLLQIGGNRELIRVFPSIGIHIIHARYQIAELQRLRAADYREIEQAVMGGDATHAEAVGRAHVANVRNAIIELSTAR